MEENNENLNRKNIESREPKESDGKSELIKTFEEEDSKTSEEISIIENDHNSIQGRINNLEHGEETREVSTENEELVNETRENRTELYGSLKNILKPSSSEEDKFENNTESNQAPKNPDINAKENTGPNHQQNENARENEEKYANFKNEVRNFFEYTPSIRSGGTELGHRINNSKDKEDLLGIFIASYEKEMSEAKDFARLDFVYKRGMEPMQPITTPGGGYLGIMGEGDPSTNVLFSGLRREIGSKIKELAGKEQNMSNDVEGVIEEVLSKEVRKKNGVNMEIIDDLIEDKYGKDAKEEYKPYYDRILKAIEREKRLKEEEKPVESEIRAEASETEKDEIKSDVSATEPITPKEEPETIETKPININEEAETTEAESMKKMEEKSEDAGSVENIEDLPKEMEEAELKFDEENDERLKNWEGKSDEEKKDNIKEKKEKIKTDLESGVSKEIIEKEEELMKYHGELKERVEESMKKKEEIMEKLLQGGENVDVSKLDPSSQAEFKEILSSFTDTLKNGLDFEKLDYFLAKEDDLLKTHEEREIRIETLETMFEAIKEYEKFVEEFEKMEEEEKEKVREEIKGLFEKLREWKEKNPELYKMLIVAGVVSAVVATALILGIPSTEIPIGLIEALKNSGAIATVGVAGIYVAKKYGKKILKGAGMGLLGGSMALLSYMTNGKNWDNFMEKITGKKIPNFAYWGLEKPKGGKG